MNKISRPKWDDYFFGLAFLISQRSPDQSTKHGCICASYDNRIVGCGYNGFVRGVNDSGMPQTRPEKYEFVIHSEVNLLHNLSRPITGGDKIYVTGYPCVQCFSQLIQAGVKKIFATDRKGYSNPPLTQTENVERLCKEANISLEICKPNLNWIYDEKLKNELTNLGFVTI